MPTVYRHAALADGTGPELLLEQTLIEVDGRISYLGDDADAPERVAGAREIDAGGACIVPGLVDAHSHTVLPGGSHWVDRIEDATDELRRVAEDNGQMAMAAGIRWFRDVGSPRRDDRALALEVRDAWRGRSDRPYVRAAGTWIAATGMLDVMIQAEDADALVAAVETQIDDGADLVKLYLDGPDRDACPWTADEVGKAVATAHARGTTVTAHATVLAGARAGVEGGVDCIEHGTQLDEDLAAEMAARGTYLVPTLAVMRSWDTFGDTTSLDRFASSDGRITLAARTKEAEHSVRLAAAAGVTIAAGSDFGGGSLRANQLAWEIEALAGAGLEPWRALAAATWIGGDLLGEPDAGRLRSGGPADFFLVHGNPLTDPSALWRVWNVA